MLVVSGQTVIGWKVDVIGQTSRASCLVYLGEGLIYVGSHQGDSQMIKIQEKSIEIVQTFSNIAPILDFTIMDMGSRAGESQTNEYSTGQARIVTGSGAFQDGSLRSVRSGVGMEEQGQLLQASHITDMFALRSSNTGGPVDLLLVSFVDESRVFKFDEDGVVEEQAEYKGLVLSQGTLLAANVENGHILQVTSASVRAIDTDDEMTKHQWSPPSNQSITAASTNGQMLGLSVAGVEAIVLNLGNDASLKVVVRRTFSEEGQISCIHVPDISSEICLVGFWQTTAVAILDINTFEIIQKVIMSDDAVSVPRAILLTQVIPNESPTLFVAMANGEVVTFSMEMTDSSLSSRKAMVLGTQQANFKALPAGDGIYNVFATCEHPSLIYGSEGRLVYSAVTAEKATCVCPFDCEAYPEAIAIATSEDLKIALIDTERTTHVNTLPVAESVRRLAYSTTLKAFGIGTIRRTLKDGFELIKSHFKLVDEVIFKSLDTFDLNENELVESVVRADLRDGFGETVERFVVGTAYLEDQVSDTARGRILVLAVTQDRMLQLVTELPVKGACRALGVVDGNIVAGLVKTVNHTSSYRGSGKLMNLSGRDLYPRRQHPTQNRELPNFYRSDRHRRQRKYHRNCRPHEECIRC